MNQDALEREFWIASERCKAKNMGGGEANGIALQVGGAPRLSNPAPIPRQFTKLNFPRVKPQHIEVWA